MSKKQEAFEFNQYLSFMDTQKHPLWKAYEENWDEKILEKILYDMGADIERNGYEIVMLTHRPRTVDRIVHCQYVHFTERTDKFWMDNYMQTEDIVRNHPSEIVRVGMRLAMNESKGDADRVKARMVSVDIKCKEGK